MELDSRLIFFAVILIISIISKIRESQKKSAVTMEQPETFAPAEEDEYARQVFEPQPEPKRQPQNDLKKAPKRKPSRVMSAENEGVPAFAHTQMEMRPLQEEDEHVPDFSISSLDDAKRAVVCAEIFNRKYC